MPNVVVILIDDQGYGDFSCFGNPVLKTPQMDKLGPKACLTDFHVAPMCTSTRSQLISGRDCLANGAMNVSSGRCRCAAACPPWPTSSPPPAIAADSSASGTWATTIPTARWTAASTRSIFYPSSHIGSAADFWDNYYFDDTYNHNGRREKFHGLYAPTCSSPRPSSGCGRRPPPASRSSAICPPNAPHAPLHVPEKYRRMYEDREFPGVAPNSAEDRPLLRHARQHRREPGPTRRIPPRSGLRETRSSCSSPTTAAPPACPCSTPACAAARSSLYEGGHRVPCFIRWPAGKLRPAGDVAELTEAQDLLPTLAGLCGIKTPPVRGL